jgi:hypothetical protein
MVPSIKVKIKKTEAHKIVITKNHKFTLLHKPGVASNSKDPVVPRVSDEEFRSVGCNLAREGQTIQGLIRRFAVALQVVRVQTNSVKLDAPVLAEVLQRDLDEGEQLVPDFLADEDQQGPGVGAEYEESWPAKDARLSPELRLAVVANQVFNLVLGDGRLEVLPHLEDANVKKESSSPSLLQGGGYIIAL